MAKTVVSCLMMKTIEVMMESSQPRLKQTIHPMSLVFSEHLHSAILDI